MADRIAAKAREAKRAGAKFLSFALGHEVYGVDILKVQEIIRLMEITAVPNTPPHVRGVINLRGEVVAVIDLRLRFGMPPREDNDRTCIVVMQVPTPEGGTLTRGVIVDKVAEVLTVADENLEPPPELGERVDISFLKALGKVDDKVILILDADRVLVGDEGTFDAGTEAGCEPKENGNVQ